jgi:hypothetical protein
MRFAIETWAAEYGAPTSEAVLGPAETVVDPNVEVPVAEWAPRPRPADTHPAETIVFVDGVRRVEARVWVTAADGDVRQGICASYAAGAVRCDGRAELLEAQVRRGLFCPAEGAEAIVTPYGAFAVNPATTDDPEDLSLVLQREMSRLEVDVACAHAASGELIVVDGPLKAGQDVPGAVGYVKTHHRAYGPPIVGQVVTRLAAGERTPLFLMEDRRGRWSWYLRLPGEVTHGWSCVVRCEAPSSMPLAEAVVLADVVGATLPRFASTPHKDPRAPQNLHPIAGLERDLRRRLGDPQLLFRGLRQAAAA